MLRNKLLFLILLLATVTVITLFSVVVFYFNLIAPSSPCACGSPDSEAGIRVLTIYATSFMLFKI